LASGGGGEYPLWKGNLNEKKKRTFSGGGGLPVDGGGKFLARKGGELLLRTARAEVSETVEGSTGYRSLREEKDGGKKGLDWQGEETQAHRS